MNENEFFECEASNKLWEEYFLEVDKYLTRISYEEGRIIRKELESHAFEAAQAESVGSELERLEKSFAKLGTPKEIVPPMVAEALIKAAQGSNNPLHVIHAALFQTGRGIMNTLRSISIVVMIAFSIVLFAMACLKPFMPENVGLFTSNVGPMRFGFGVLLGTENLQEHLGLGFIPIALILSFSFYKLSILLLSTQNSC